MWKKYNLILKIARTKRLTGTHKIKEKRYRFCHLWKRPNYIDHSIIDFIRPRIDYNAVCIPIVSLFEQSIFYSWESIALYYAGKIYFFRYFKIRKLWEYDGKVLSANLNIYFRNYRLETKATCADRKRSVRIESSSLGLYFSFIDTWLHFSI